MNKLVTSKWPSRILGLILLSVTAFSVVLYFRPIDTLTTLENISLKLQGFDRRTYGPFDTHVFNSCTSPDQANCQCFLFLHGLGDRSQTWRQLFNKWPKDLSPHRMVFAPNLRGSNQSQMARDPGEYRVSQQAKDLVATFSPLCPGSWTVVGNSLGGWVAAWIGHYFSQSSTGHLSQLILLSPAGFHFDYGDLLKVFIDPTPEKLRHFYRLAYYKIQYLPDFLFLGLSRRLYMMPLIDFLKAQKDEDFLTNPSLDVTSPIRLIWGDHDEVIPLSVAQAFKNRFLQTQFHLGKNCGHLPQKECPETVYSAIRSELSDEPIPNKDHAQAREWVD